jgi:hypothetical protein
MTAVVVRRGTGPSSVPQVQIGAGCPSPVPILFRFLLVLRALVSGGGGVAAPPEVVMGFLVHRFQFQIVLVLFTFFTRFIFLPPPSFSGLAQFLVLVVWCCCVAVVVCWGWWLEVL